MEDEVAETTRKRCGLAKLRECDELLYGRRLPLSLNGAVYSRYVRLAILYESETWCRRKVRWEFYEGKRDSL